jgi:hypothetical protein
VDAVESLRALRSALLELHGAVVEHERIAYERVYGRVSAGELLQLTVGGKWFDWVRPLSGMVVRIDEALAADEPPGEGESAALAAAAGTLVAGGEAPGALGRPYAAALQESPAAVLAHAEVRRALRTWPAPDDDAPGASS